jgi:hypothetical protein
MNINKNQIQSIRQSFADKSGCCTKQAMKQWLNPNEPNDGPIPEECCGLPSARVSKCTYQREIQSHTIPLNNLQCCTNIAINNVTNGGIDGVLTATVGFNTYNIPFDSSFTILVCPSSLFKIEFLPFSITGNASIDVNLKNLGCEGEDFNQYIKFNVSPCSNFEDFGIDYVMSVYEDPICLSNPYPEFGWNIPENWCPFELTITGQTISDCADFNLIINGNIYQIKNGIDYEFTIKPSDVIQFEPIAGTCNEPSIIAIPFTVKECNKNPFTTLIYRICV